MSDADWIAVDWGTSNVRVWAMGPTGEVLATRASDRGMGQLAPEGFEPALLDLVGDLLPVGRATPVLICGMAGARQGWVEAPYLPAPCAPDGTGAVAAPTSDARLAVHILPGVSQSAPADVMRGEETQIAGHLAEDPTFGGVLCLPGTHTKWVQVAGGQILSFRTAMTGEVFGALTNQTVLRHSMGDGWSDDAFANGLDEGFANPGHLLLDLFSLRPATLLGQLDADGAKARLSGLLLGAELAATRAMWQGHPVVVIGSDGLSARYVAAITRLGGRATPAPTPVLALKGLIAARAALHAPAT